MGEPEPQAARSGTTAWARSLETPLRLFLRTETGSAAVLLAATLAALAWANIAPARLRRGAGAPSCRSGSAATGWTRTCASWVNSGLMTFFFLVVGPGGAARVRHGRAARAPPAGAAAGGRGRRHGRAGRDLPGHQRGPRLAHGWGVAMSTDTAFALGMLALVGPPLPDRVRTFLLTVAVVDDLVALVVIAVVVQRAHLLGPLLVGVGDRCVVTGGRAARLGLRSGAVVRAARRGRLGGVLRVRASTRSSSACVMGLLTVRLPGRRATTWSGPRSCSAGSASSRRRSWPGRRGAGVAAAISPNDRLQQLYHPWTSYLIVPLFALANAGIDDQRRAAGPRVHLADHAGHPGRLRASASRSGSSAPPGC